jgi:RNA polymerase sigma-70 factor (sigma-E family)
VHEANGQTEFTVFVRRHWAQLMTIGVAVSGNRADAEDLVQAALAGVYRNWHTIDQDRALAYLRRSIANGQVSRWRRRRSESLVDEPPETPHTGGMDRLESRLVLVPLLRTLPDRQRAVIVLRYLCDLADDEIAATLGTTRETVRSQAARGLATLRARSAAAHSVTVASKDER